MFEPASPDSRRHVDEAKRGEIELRSECGGCLKDTAVLLSSDGHPDIPHRTDGDGRFRLPESVQSETVVRIRAEGFEPRDVEFESGVPLALVELRSALAIEGYVRTRSPGLDPTVIQVVAIPCDTPLGVVERSRLPDAKQVVYCEPDGAFHLACLSPHSRYTILAGGPGWVAAKPDAEPWPCVAPGIRGVQLELRRMFIAELTCVDTRGTPARMPARNLFSGSRRTWSSVPGVESMSEAHAEHQLGGYLPEWDSLPKGSLIRMFVGDLPDTVVGPNGISIDVPGYEPVEATYWASAAEIRPVTCTKVVCTPTSEAWGSIRLKFTRSDGQAVRAEDCPDGRLVLAPASGRSLEYGVMTRLPEVLIEDVPAGSYRVGFVPRVGSGAHPARAEDRPLLRIGEEPATFEIPIDSYSTLTIRLIAEDGTEYRGPVSFMLGSVRRDANSGELIPDRQKAIRSVDSAPVVMTGIRSGPYVLRLLSPRQAEPGPAGFEKDTVVEVTPDMTPVQVRVRPRP